MSSRKRQIAALEEALGSRRLIYSGFRGEDAEPLLALPQFRTSFCRAAPLPTSAVEQQTAEDITGYRPALSRSDALDPPEDLLLGPLLDAASMPSAISFPAPNRILDAVRFSRPACEFLGPSFAQQASFTNKAWVEQSLRALGVPVLDWRYVSPRDPSARRVIDEALSNGPAVLRTADGLGGSGHKLIRESSRVNFEKLRKWPVISIGPFYDRHVPLNIGACVFGDGTIRLHAASLQIVGIDLCAPNGFAYCGNDFGRIRSLDTGQVQALESMTLTAGRWLHKHGYRGGFGVDAMIIDGEVRFCEINPRAQGSSTPGSAIEAELDLPDFTLDHIAAWLGMPPEPPLPLAELVREQAARAQVFVANLSEETLRPAAAAEDDRVRQVPAGHVNVLPEAVLFKLELPYSVTDTGLELHQPVRDLIEQTRARLYAAPAAGEGPLATPAGSP